MNLLPSLAAWQFALAGVACAAVAVVIHFLNRRRQRTVRWAAMELLTQALRQQRKLIRLVDLLLLLLRVSAVLFFGFALAQPYWSSANRRLVAGEPVHVVLLLDNSLSMAFETLEGTLLDQAKQRARRVIDDLPRGSQVTVLPVCGSRFEEVNEPLSDRQQALDVLDRIEVLDRSASASRIWQAAKRATQHEGELTDQVILFTDRQRQIWADFVADSDGADQGENSGQLPLQIVDVAPASIENCWVADIQVQDGIADVQTPARVLVRVKSQGVESRNVQVWLSVGQQRVDSRSITLDADDEREVTFSYRFPPPQEDKGVTRFVPISASITPDLLTLDDERHGLVPVAARLPVVFVDQFGDREAVLAGRVGESNALRRLMSPIADGNASAAQPLQAYRIEQLTRPLLQDARLVVLAGVASPAEQVPLLRQFVEQGGQLLITAGGDFDARAWNAVAWRDGAGILPSPLDADPLGVLPEQAEQLTPFAISFDSLAGDDSRFQLAGVSQSELRALYAEALFFKAIRLAPSGINRPQPAETPDGTAKDAERWLRWPRPDPAAVQPADKAPRVLARFTDPQNTPFLIERYFGHGRVLFVSSGVQSNWNTLPKTNAILLFDRLLRSMLGATLPVRNFATQEQIALPLGASGSPAELSLIRPGQIAIEGVDYGFIGGNQRGIAIERPFQRGVYRLVERSSTLAQSVETVTELAVNGSESESDLSRLEPPELANLAANYPLRWLGKDQQPALTSAPVLGRNSWWWLVLLTLVLLSVECVLWRVGG